MLPVKAALHAVGWRTRVPALRIKLGCGLQALQWDSPVVFCVLIVHLRLNSGRYIVWGLRQAKEGAGEARKAAERGADTASRKADETADAAKEGVDSAAKQAKHGAGKAREGAEQVRILL